MTSRKYLFTLMVLLALAVLSVACGGAAAPAQQAPAQEAAPAEEEVAQVEEAEVEAEEPPSRGATEEEEPPSRGSAPSDFTVGQEVAAYDSFDQIWVKGTITEINGDEVKINYVHDGWDTELTTDNSAEILTLDQAQQQGLTLVNAGADSAEESSEEAGAPDEGDDQAAESTDSGSDADDEETTAFEPGAFVAVNLGDRWVQGKYMSNAPGGQHMVEVEAGELTAPLSLEDSEVMSLEDAQAQGIQVEIPQEMPSDQASSDEAEAEGETASSDQAAPESAEVSNDEAVTDEAGEQAAIEITETGNNESAAPAGQTITSEGCNASDQFIQAALKEHDLIRAAATQVDHRDRAKNMMWSKELACQAEEWAKLRVSGGYLSDARYSGNGPHSDVQKWPVVSLAENMAGGPRKYPEDGIKAWGSEIEGGSFDGEQWNCTQECGHWNTIIMSNMIYVGCGVAKAPEGASGSGYDTATLVCQYGGVYPLELGKDYAEKSGGQEWYAIRVTEVKLDTATYNYLDENGQLIPNDTYTVNGAHNMGVYKPLEDAIKEGLPIKY